MDDTKLLSAIEVGQIIATFLVVVGVAGEFIGTFMARPVQRQLDAKLELEIARLRRDAAEAELRAKELEALIQPRYLTKAQEDSIAASMRVFAGSGMIIASHWIDTEAARLAEQIKTSLNRAGIGIDDKHLNTMTVDKIGAYPEIVTGMFGGGGGIRVPTSILESKYGVLIAGRLGDWRIRSDRMDSSQRSLRQNPKIHSRTCMGRCR